MRELRDRVAVVTGGASGIGRGMAIAFADAGMNVVVADIEADRAAKVAGELGERGARALAVETDVSDRASVEALAERTYADLGAAHVLCNNAGVAVFGPLDQMSDDDWRWLLSVNLEGVVNGLQAFLGRMKAQGGEAHIVNTASGAGLSPFPVLGAYVATKYAVVGISETLRAELAPANIGVTVLCPGVVSTEIFHSERNRPAALGGSRSATPTRAQAAIAGRGMDPLRVGRLVRQAVLDDDLYAFTHPEIRSYFETRAAAVGAAFDRWSEWKDPEG